jgi:hypothetical protein
VYAKVFLRRADRTIQEFAGAAEARGAAAEGDVLVLAHRGGHCEYEAAILRDGVLTFVPQPEGWRPRMPVDRGETPGPADAGSG